MQKRGLGRGLDSLLPPLEDGDRLLHIELDRISTNPDQPRQHFDQASISELAASIREHGVVQPVIVRPSGDGYQLVAGERRLRATREAGLKSIPAIVRDLSETQSLEIALIENLQREDLNPMEEAEAYRKLNEEFGFTQDDIAKRVGRSRPQISNTLRLLQLELEVQSLVRAGRLAAGHARALLGISNASVQRATADRIVQKAMSVREAEIHVSALVGREQKPVTRRTGRKPDADIEEVENRLRSFLGTKVKITGDQQRGKLEIYYFSADDLDRVVSVILEPNAEEATGVKK